MTQLQSMGVFADIFGDSESEDEDRILESELLHEKWESTPVAQIPFDVKMRLWDDLSVDIEHEAEIQEEDGWDIEYCSSRKRRRLQKLAKAAVENDKMLDALECASQELPLVLRGVGARYS